MDLINQRIKASHFHNALHNPGLDYSSVKSDKTTQLVALRLFQ